MWPCGKLTADSKVAPAGRRLRSLCVFTQAIQIDVTCMQLAVVRCKGFKRYYAKVTMAPGDVSEMLLPGIAGPAGTCMHA